MKDDVKERIADIAFRVSIVAAVASLLYLAWFLLRAYCIVSFRIPTDSMLPAIFPGDYVLALRLPPCKVRRNDVIFFKFPYRGSWDEISTEGGRFYVKRCVGLPGDTLEIRDGIYKVRGCDETLGNLDAQKELHFLLAGITEDSVARSIGICLDAWPTGDDPSWTVLEFGPLAIPAAGTTVAINDSTTRLYGNLIRWEQGGTLPDGDSYTFKKNYYFVAGDRAENSQDSRYWGLLPEDHVKARAMFVWCSKSPYTGRVQWSRIGKRVR